ncbi:MAG: DUF1467 family protein [Rhodospirillales bacterium]|nr:DUF1467 family protein [Rhodospirillales bacterium]
MTFVTGIAIYVTIWWTVLFAVLPWGVRPSDNPGKGHAESAPEKPRLLIKAVVTSVISAIIWGIIFWLIEANVFSFRDMASQA